MGNKRLAGVVATLQFANGRPKYAGALTSANPTVVSNSTTATPFTLDAGEWLTLQPDAPGYVGFGPDSATAIAQASATQGIYLAGNEKFSVLTHGQEAYVAFLAATGSANCRVWTQS